ncbi:hypothetical protein EJA71_03785 [Pseudomonas sp. PB106]|nr:hypothetical protein EJA71_03785 [Pseudomonas sp. PB106]
MSRSLGLREDQCWKDELVTRIIGFLPVEPRWCHRWQASSHNGFGEDANPVGAGLPAIRPEQAPKN